MINDWFYRTATYHHGRGPVGDFQKYCWRKMTMKWQVEPGDCFWRWVIPCYIIYIYIHLWFNDFCMIYIYMVFQCISMYFNPIGWFESIMNWAYRMSQIDVQNKGGINVVRDSYLSCKADLTIWNSMDGSMGISGSIWMEVFSLVPYFSGHILLGIFQDPEIPIVF